MSIGLMVLVRLKDELSFDKFHPYGQNVPGNFAGNDTAHNVCLASSHHTPSAAALQKDNAFMRRQPLLPGLER